MGDIMKNILITGSSGELGTDLALLFSKNKYNVILHYYKNKESILKLKEQIKYEYNMECQIIQADIKNEDEVKAMAKQLNKIDVLINNAAYYNDDEFYNKEINIVKEVVETNLIGTYLVSREISKLMKNGVIINISSNNAFNSNYSESMDYDMSKAGIVSLTNNLADLLNPIRVITVAPGWIDTTKNKELSPEFKNNQMNKILLNRFADIREISEVVLFLASEKASYINKTVITIDGGIK